MSEIKTLAELLALPVGAVLVDLDGDAWQKLERDSYRCAALVAGWASPRDAADLLDLEPLMVVHLPDAGQTRSMVRCCGHHCMTTTPLPTGATWLCVEHGGEPIDTARGTK